MSERRMVEDVRARDFTFGVEIETAIPDDSGVSVGGYTRGSAVTGGYDKDTREWIDAPTYHGVNFRAGGDSSISCNYDETDAEFWTPVLKGEDGIEFVLEMVRFIKRVGGRVNSSTGLHVHVGVASVIGQYADVDTTLKYLKKVGAITMTYAHAIYAQTGTRRDRHHYCAPWSECEKDALKGARSRYDVSIARERILNLTNVFGGKGTVEFRAFAGTLNTRKVMHHIGTALAICSRAFVTKQARWNDSRGMGASSVGGEGEKALKGFWNANNWILGASRIGWNQETGEATAFGLFGRMFEENKQNRKTARAMARKFDGRVANSRAGLAC